MGLLSILESLTSDERVEQVLAARAAAVAKAWETRRSDQEDKDGLHHFIEPRFLVRKKAAVGPWGTSEEQFLDQSQLEQLDEELAQQWRSAFQPLGDLSDDGPTRLETLLKLGNRIVITEDAGAGKSIFTHWAIAWLSTQDAWRRMNDRGLPILAVRFERDNEKWPLTWEGYLGELACKLAKHSAGAENWSPGENVPKIAEVVTKHALREGRVVIFCDALDQIVGNDAQKQLEAFWSFLGQLADNFPGVKIVVTSRATAVQKHAGRFKAPWKHAIVAGFSAVEQVRYLADLIPNSVLSEDDNFAELSEEEAIEILSNDRLFGEFHAQVADLLQTPVILSIIRNIAEKNVNNQGEFPRFSNRADLYFQATTRLLNRNLEKGEQFSDSAMGELREALSATAFAMMILEAGSYAVRGESEMARLSKLAKSYASPELKSKWTDVWKKLQQIADVSHRLIVEEKSNDFFGWKHKGMMEFYAGLFLAKNELPAWKQPEIRLEDHLENEHLLTDLLAKSHWNWAVRFAIELPQAENGAAQTFADIPTLRRTLTALFAPPTRDIRPTKCMYRAWELLRFRDDKRQGSAKKYLEDLRNEGQEILASFQQQFTQILTDGEISQAAIAAQVVPFERLKRMVEFGQLTAKRLDDLENSQPAEIRKRLSLHRTFVHCPATGDEGFLMGTPGQEGKPEHPHHVRLDAFWMAATQVTRDQYALFDPNYEAAMEYPHAALKNKGGRCPVIHVDWYSAFIYADFTGNMLPTEAQWEYACRAGSTGDFCIAKIDGEAKPIDEANLSRVAFWNQNLDTGPQEVAHSSLEPNLWGLFDMHGNVWEWLADWYDPSYFQSLDAAGPNPEGPHDGSSRVLRGGVFADYVAQNLRCARRGGFEPWMLFNFVGFRLRGLSSVALHSS